MNFRVQRFVHSVVKLISKNHYTCSEQQLYAAKIKNSTIVCTNHLTPEIKLHLITEKCKLWHLPADQCEFNDPFWAFYWPGGQAISR